MDGMNDALLAISQDELGGPEILKRLAPPRPGPGLGEILAQVRTPRASARSTMTSGLVACRRRSGRSTRRPTRTYVGVEEFR